MFNLDWVWDGSEFLQFSTQFSLVSMCVYLFKDDCIDKRVVYDYI